MATPSYPGTIKTYTDKVDNVSVVQAADINSVQAEVTAIETAIGTSPATSLIPGNTGSYNASGVSTSLSARVGNLEAAITGNSADGSKIGWTQLATGSVGTSNSISVTGSSYNRLVVVVNCTDATAGSAITMTVNGCTSSKYGHMSFATTPGGAGSSAGGGGVPITSAQTWATLGASTVVAEINNANGSGTKPVTFTNSYGWGAGMYVSGGTTTSAVSTISLTCGTAPTAATYTVYGVK